jgi:hypothetical protein
MRMERQGGAAEWAASRAQAWLRFWKDEIGKEAFHPFDLLAATYAIAPGLLKCARAGAWIADDAKLWGWIYGPQSLLVGTSSERPAKVAADSSVLYCPRAADALGDRVRARLVGGIPPRTGESRCATSASPNRSTLRGADQVPTH